MNWQTIKSQINDQFADRIQKWREHNPRRIYLDIAPEVLPAFGAYLFNVHKARFIIVSAVDTPRDLIEVLYHFDFQGLPQVLTLRVLLPKSKLEIESLAPVIKGTEWIERELNELFGIRFNNHPNMKHLLLPDDWPEGNYPLRRDQ